MAVFDLTRNETFDTSRKSLISASVFTLLAQNATLHSESITFFGLSFGVDQPSIVALGQIVTVYFFVSYAANFGENILKHIEEIKTIENKNLYDRDKYTLEQEELEIFDPGNADANRPEDPFWDSLNQAHAPRLKLEKRLRKRRERYSFLKELVFKLGFVVGLAALAVFEPEALQQAIKVLTSAKP